MELVPSKVVLAPTHLKGPTCGGRWCWNRERLHLHLPCMVGTNKGGHMKLMSGEVVLTPDVSRETIMKEHTEFALERLNLQLLRLKKTVRENT